LEDTTILTETETVPCNFSISQCENEGIKYVAGYVAHFFLKDHPELGQRSAEIPVLKKNTAPWISVLSRGGLVVPSENFMSQIYEMEKVFRLIHKDSISLQPKVISNFHKILVKKFPSLPRNLLKKYARTRTFIRIRFLNSQLKSIENDKNAARKRKQISQFLN